MKRTLFSVVLIGAGLAVGGFETGDGLPKPPEREWAARTRALERARVFREDASHQSTVDLVTNPNSGVTHPELTVCKYAPDEVSGTTPKFECVLESGDIIKVKYGFTGEIPSEIGATRLLHALGFGADRVSRVKLVRCYGCPLQPFHTRSLWELVGIAAFMDKHLDYAHYRDFANVSVERNLDGEPIQVGDERGWGFFELDTIDPARGGATRAEIDALRLTAIFLHHWDNNTANQRLTCPGADTPDCAHPLAMIHDVGAAFGPRKMSLETWRSKPVWADIATCRVSMKWMPYNGGTFTDADISEEGRLLLARRLSLLPPRQVEALFASAGFEDVSGWVAAFNDRVRQIVDRAPCPATAQLSAFGFGPDRSSRLRD